MNIVLRTKLYSDEAFKVISAGFSRTPRMSDEIVVRDANDEVVIMNADSTCSFSSRAKLGEWILEKLIKNVIVIEGEQYVTFGNRRFEDIDKCFNGEYADLDYYAFRMSDDKGHPMLPLEEMNFYTDYGYSTYQYRETKSFDFKIVYGIAQILKGKTADVEKHGLDVEKLIGKEEVNPIIIQSRTNILKQLYDCIVKALHKPTNISELYDIIKQNDFEEGVTVDEFIKSIKWHKTNTNDSDCKTWMNWRI